MASIGADANGHRRILFVAEDRQRKTIRLGKCSQRDAEQVCRHVEALLASVIHSQPLGRETSVWLGNIGNNLHDRLARVGLVTPRANVNATLLASFIDTYITGRSDAKPRTIINLQQARKALVGYFGESKPLATITPGDADNFRLHLLAKGLAENTVRRMCGRARQYFAAAVRHELLHRNPFAGIKCAVGANPKRRYFLTREDAAKVLAACPNAEWRLIFALSRFGGLRCPSEHLALRWTDVDWEHNRIIITSPKTEHYDGKGSRQIPLFPELRPYLHEAFDEAPIGAEYVITRYRSANANLRSQLERIIRRAGLQPWPKLFHNLRATRETELTERFPLHVVCAWIGNSAAVAAKHYLQVTDQHFTQAAGDDPTPIEKTAQNPAQQVHAGSGNEPHEESVKTKNPAICGAFPTIAAARYKSHCYLIPPRGFEPLSPG